MAKLVRDKIPEIILEKTGKVPEIEFIKNDKLYVSALCDKLKEETAELIEIIGKNNPEKEIEEIADVLEVLDAIIAFKKHNMQKIQDCKLKKLKERGGFERRIKLL